MYIHKTYKFISENKKSKEYRTQLKQISKINLRRSSKFNILAVIGAINCTKEINLSSNIGIYVSTEYGPISDVQNVLKTVSEDNHIVMPFDFLNINTNNVGFYVSQALNAKGKNMVLTSRYISFEKTLSLAAFDFETKSVNDILIGGVDESLEDIENYDNYLKQSENLESKDGSCWFYANNKKENALAKITEVEEFNDINALKLSLKESYSKITLNQFAEKDEKVLSLINKDNILNTNEFYGSEGVLKLLELMEYRGKNLHIAKDPNNNYIKIEIDTY